MKSSHHRFSLLTPAVCLFAFGLVACNTPAPREEMVRSNITGEGAPSWIQGSIEQIPGTVSFVGRGGGINVLDERHAFDEALGHARAQLANFVATKVTAEACLEDSSHGARFLSLNSHRAGDGEEANQWMRSQIHEIARAVVGGLAVSDQHWEQWLVSNELPEGFMANRTNRDGSIRRYKCWVLASVDSATVDAYVKTTLTALENSQKADEALAQLKETRGDLTAAANTLTAQELELQLLRERIHYGRRFRLTEAEDCLHYPGTCSFELNHPTWEAPVYLTETVLKERSASPCFCPPTNCSH